MKKGRSLSHKFVDYIPDDLEEGVAYVALEFGTVVHLCFCGCGEEVVTPLSPTDWTLSYNGETISLNPSIGNWSLECQSHYWIRNDAVVWARHWSRDEIEAGRRLDRWQKEQFFRERSSEDSDSDKSAGIIAVSEGPTIEGHEVVHELGTVTVKRSRGNSAGENPELIRWKRLPFWKRWFTKRPEATLFESPNADEKEEAIELLKKRAVKRGANGLVDVRIAKSDDGIDASEGDEWLARATAVRIRPIFTEDDC